MLNLKLVFHPIFPVPLPVTRHWCKHFAIRISVFDVFLFAFALPKQINKLPLVLVVVFCCCYSWLPNWTLGLRLAVIQSRVIESGNESKRIELNCKSSAVHVQLVCFSCVSLITWAISDFVYSTFLALKSLMFPGNSQVCEATK